MKWIDALEREGRALSVAARHDPAAAVPGCPGWDVSALLRHIGESHRWAARMVRERPAERPEFKEQAPQHGSLDWYENGLALLLETLRAGDPAAPTYTFGPDGTCAFWYRRMAHETLVHRVDAEQATGVVGPVESALAVDGIAEHLEVFLPMVAARDKGPAGPTVHLHATDVEGEWLLTFGDGAVAVEQGHAKGDAAVRGPAGELDLWLWGRVPTSALEIFGDASLAERLQRVARV